MPSLNLHNNIKKQLIFDMQLMEKAVNLTKGAEREDEVPVAALIVNKEGKIISKAYNQKEKSFNPCAHAELLAIIKACKKNKNWRLIDHTLYVTLEPCPMCLAAIGQARIKRLVFGAYDTKGGSLSLGYLLHQDSKMNHQIEVTGGILENDCSQVLKAFFKEKRKK